MTIDMCKAAEHARSQSKVIRQEAINKVGKSRYVESNKGSFDNYPSTKTKWRRNQPVQTSVQNRQQKQPNGTPCQQSHADGICPANGPATSVANQIKSNQTRAHNIHLATRAKMNMHGRCTICQRIKRLQENHQ